MRYFDNGGKRAVWVMHRRGGKDSTMINQATKMALKRVGTYWHMLPSLRQGRKVIWEAIDKSGRRVIDQAIPPEIRKKDPNHSDMKIELKNGSIIQIVGSDNYDSLVGSNPVHVTFSEWSLTRPSAWDYLRPILLENEGTASFIYTPRGKNHGWDLYQVAKKNPKWFCALMTIEDTKALPLDFLDEERNSGMPEERIQQEYYCDFTANMVGSYYGELLRAIEDRGDYCEFNHEIDEVQTHWDIGFTDSTAIWFWRINKFTGEVEIIDCYEAHGLPVSHYIDVLYNRPYRYTRHWLPHDANDSRFRYATGMSIREQLMQTNLPIAITPKLSLEDGIQAARKTLQSKIKFHSRVKQGWAALENYHREYDEDTKTFAQRPEHDWSSHFADAFRYMSVTLNAAKLLSESSENQQKSRIIQLPSREEMTLDELWEHRDRNSRRVARI